MPTDDRKFTNESEKSATRPQQDNEIRDLPERDESDRSTQDENVKGGRMKQRPDDLL